MTDAWIISVGNEVLSGKVVNSNAAWLGARLTSLGFLVKRMVVVGDLCEDIMEAFKEAISKEVKVIVSTGGLGPTFDDMTVECIGRAFALPLEYNKEALALLKEKYGGELTEHRLKMARMPRGAKALRNPVGTAPGMALQIKGSLVIALPGVPDEMKAIFEGEALGLIEERKPQLYYYEEAFNVLGVPESLAAPIIEEVMKGHGGVYIKSHPKGRELRGPLLELRLEARRQSVEEARGLVKKAAEELKAKLSQRGGRIQG